MSASTIVRRPQSLARTPASKRADTTVAAGTAVLVASVPWALSERWWVESALVAALLVAVAAVTADLTSRRIPDRVVLASLVPTAIAIAALIAAGDGRSAVLGPVSGATAFAIPLLIVHVADPSALGFGDVKLAAALGAALGLVDWRTAVGALCLASGATVTVALVRRRSALPFAPGLVAGAALVLLLPTWEGSLPW